MIHLKNYFINLPSGETLFGPINMEVLPGEVLIIKGRNGGGKSTLLQHLALRGFEDNVVNVTKNQIAYLPQKYGLDFDFPFTLADALLQTSPKKTKVGAPIYQLAESINLKRPWATASGGERKKVLLLRCLKMQAKILLFDEPFNNLDQKSRALFLLDLNSYLDINIDTCVAIITHDEIYDSFKNKNIKYLELN